MDQYDLPGMQGSIGLPRAGQSQSNYPASMQDLDAGYTDYNQDYPESTNYGYSAMDYTNDSSANVQQPFGSNVYGHQQASLYGDHFQLVNYILTATKSFETI